MARYRVGLCPCQGFPIAPLCPSPCTGLAANPCGITLLPTPPLRSSPHCARSDAASAGGQVTARFRERVVSRVWHFTGGGRLERARGKRSRHRPRANGTALNTGRRSCTGGILGLHTSSSLYSNKCGCFGHGGSQAGAVSAGGSAVLAQSVHPSSKRGQLPVLSRAMSTTAFWGPAC